LPSAASSSVVDTRQMRPYERRTISIVFASPVDGTFINQLSIGYVNPYGEYCECSCDFRFGFFLL
jgi:hypothetical protein